MYKYRALKSDIFFRQQDVSRLFTEELFTTEVKLHIPQLSLFLDINDMEIQNPFSFYLTLILYLI